MTDETPRLSPSVAWKIESECPHAGWREHRLLGNQRKPPTDDMERGTIVHALMLQSGLEQVVEVDAADFKTKAAREIRDQARAEGRIPIVTSKLKELELAAGALIAGLWRHGISLDGGAVEDRLEWSEWGVDFCGHPDWVSPDRTKVLEIKTTKGSVHPDACVRSILSGPGIYQEAAYKRGLCAQNSDLWGRIDFVFAFCQLEPPYYVTPIRLSSAFQQMAATKWERAADTWQRCLEKGTDEKHWPGYVPDEVGVMTVSPPAWALRQEEDAELAREMGDE